MARWQGSVHAATVFNNSRIRALFEVGNSLLLEDGGYPLRSYFMTPLQNPRTRAEQLYNELHTNTQYYRACIWNLEKKISYFSTWILI